MTTEEWRAVFKRLAELAAPTILSNCAATIVAHVSVDELRARLLSEAERGGGAPTPSAARIMSHVEEYKALAQHHAAILMRMDELWLQLSEEERKGLGEP